ncbi:hypothetical protein K469DRAFT_686122 [Zopfia rhizophila CBS 207.26]|uniref:Uncharacterized protein n=1 Tax=Zopfia rhizophila CBS 207.26 TaxID=1314779 RepID=A0A6A6E7A7_9PEZI|nr:hypothetical protein K469DRAFT_686122 [Zopfia rhizophila CBS 207.26]
MPCRKSLHQALSTPSYITRRRNWLRLASSPIPPPPTLPTNNPDFADGNNHQDGPKNHSCDYQKATYSYQTSQGNEISRFEATLKSDDRMCNRGSGVRADAYGIATEQTSEYEPEEKRSAHCNHSPKRLRVASPGLTTRNPSQDLRACDRRPTYPHPI